MPHLCTNCGESFPDGSKEMLSGCPECGGNKFQYLPADALDGDVPEEEPPTRPGDDASVTDAVGRAATSVRDYVNQRRDAVEADDGREATPDDQRAGDSTADGASAADAATEQSQPTGADAHDGTDGEAVDDIDEEDVAQQSARSEMADLEDLPGDTISAGSPSPVEGDDTPDRPSDTSPDESSAPPAEGRVVKEPDSPDRPDLEELRKELNDQFESIRIIEPGQYELNLMELYDREEHIIALQEDGRYVIEVPDTWRDEE